jgi:hypothetical protein
MHRSFDGVGATDRNLDPITHPIVWQHPLLFSGVGNQRYSFVTLWYGLGCHVGCNLSLQAERYMDGTPYRLFLLPCDDRTLHPKG